MKVFEKCAPASIVTYHRAPEHYTADEVEESFSCVSSYADLSEEQSALYRQVLKWFNDVRLGLAEQGQVLTLGGYAGTGKTTLLGVLANTLSTTSVGYCAFTGRASSILAKKLRSAGATPAAAGTIHSLFYRIIEDKTTGRITGQMRLNPEEIKKRFDLLVVDEASMVDERMAQDLMAPGVPVLAVGDHGQLPPIYGHSPWMAEPDLRLEKIHRQAEGSPIIALATHVREKKSLEGFALDGRVIDRVFPNDFDEKLQQAYAKYSPREVAILTPTNAYRMRLNELAHYLWTGQPPGQIPCKGSWLICLRNENKFNICNGMRGNLLEAAVPRRDHWLDLRLYFPNEHLEAQASCLKHQIGRHRVFEDLQAIQGACASEDMPKWPQVGLLMDYGYAMTVHKAQGSQFKHVFLLGDRPNYMSSDDYGKWLYTGVTRASERLTLVPY